MDQREMVQRGLGMMRSLLVTVIVFGLSGGTLRADRKAERPSVEELIKLAPVLSNKDPALRSFHVGARVKSPIADMRFDIACKSTAHVSILMCDANDGTPYALSVDDRLLLYEPSQDRVIVSQGNPLGAFHAWVEKGSTKLKWIFTSESDQEVRIDLKSFLLMPQLKGLNSTWSGAVVTLGGRTETGSVLRAVLDLSQATPFQSLNLATPGHEAVMEFSDIERNIAIPKNKWAFPSDESLRRTGIPISNSPTLVDWVETSGASMYRAAIRDVSLRPKWEKAFGQVDWRKAADADQRIAPLLAEVIRQTRK